MADRRADDRAGHGRGTAAIAAADLVADGSPDQAAQDHRTGRRSGAVAGLVAPVVVAAALLIAGFLVALAARLADTDPAHDRIDVDDAGVVDVRVSAAPLIPAAMLAVVSQCRSGHQRADRHRDRALDPLATSVLADHKSLHSIEPQAATCAPFSGLAARLTGRQ